MAHIGGVARLSGFRLLGCLLALAALFPVGRARASSSLVVGGAASLREPLNEIGARWEALHPNTELSISFGASSQLGLQIRSGAPIDIFISADPRIVTDLIDRKLVDLERCTVLLRNRIVIMASSGWHFEAEDPKAHLDRARRIAVAGSGVPLGRYSREWLSGQGLSEGVEERVVLTEHARATLSAVDAGHVDLAIVYQTDALLARRARILFEIPSAEQPSIRYAVAPILRPSGQDSSQREVAAQFAETLASPASRAIFERFNFHTVTERCDAGHAEIRP